MELKNTVLLRETEEFMRGELDNVTVAAGRLTLDYVQGAFVPYGCYTSAPLPLPTFDALRLSWNAAAPAGTAVEAQVRVMVDGNWSAWTGFGKWSPYLKREGPAPWQRGPLRGRPDVLELDSKLATQAQLRIYLYTKDEKTAPSVFLLGCSVRAVDVIPGGGRPVNACLHLMPYAARRRAPALRPWMDLASALAALTNRWGADLLPEEFALVLRDHRAADEADPRNLCFAAAAAGCWGFPAWVCWGDLALLREEVRRGRGAVVMLQSTPAEQAAGMPETRFAALRGFVYHSAGDGKAQALLCDPWAAENDFDTETAMPLDDFLVAWNNLALLMLKRPDRSPPAGWPRRVTMRLRGVPGQKGLFAMTVNGDPRPLPDDFCAAGGVLAWSTQDERPHATAAHRTFHYADAPEQGGIRLPVGSDGLQKCTVYALYPSGQMLVGDVLA